MDQYYTGFVWDGLSTRILVSGDLLHIPGDEAGMRSTVMPMSDHVVKRTRAVRNDSIERMNFSRAGTLCLAALLMAAIWAAMLYLGGWLLGVPIEIGILLRISAGIFFISLFGLGLAVSAGDDSGTENGNGGDQS